MQNIHLSEQQYLAGELEAEIEALRKVPFEGIPCDRCSEKYGRVTRNCSGCNWMNNRSTGAAS